MVAKEKKYYWLKLKRDFFKRHDIQIIESMPNGKDYILFYLKLLCESVDHEGNLRFSDEIPYNEEMLSTITNTNIDVVRNAINIFTELRMMELMDDGTFYMREVEKMIGGETYWARRKREQRDQINLLPEPEEIGQCPTLSNECPTCPSKSIEKELETEIETDTEKRESKRRVFVPPTVDEVRSYCQERLSTVNPEKFVDYYTSNGWMVGKSKMRDWKSTVRNWERRDQEQFKQEKKQKGEWSFDDFR